LNEIAQRHSIRLIDPIDFLRDNFESRIAEENFVPFFFPADENHFTPVTSGLVTDFLFFNLPELDNY
jgi:hypothetical protein